MRHEDDCFWHADDNERDRQFALHFAQTRERTRKHLKTREAISFVFNLALAAAFFAFAVWCGR